MIESESNEESVLLNCLRSPQTYDFNHPFDLDKLKSLCTYHRIRPQLYELLKANPHLPEGFKSYLKEHRKQWTFRNLAFLREAQTINHAFDNAGIDILFYKGGLLSQKIYGDFSIRESCDLDIIVPPNKLLQVGELLTELGYKISRDPELWGKEVFVKADSEIEWFNEEKQITIDLHWRPNHPRTGLNFSFVDCIKHAQVYEFQNHDFTVMQAEFTFLLLACHRIKSPQRRLCHLLDLLTLSQKNTLDWNLIAQLSKEFDLQRVLSKTFTSILAIDPEIKTPNAISKILPPNWQNDHILNEDSHPLKPFREKDVSWFKKSLNFMLYSASNHDSVRKKISCNCYIFLRPSVEVMRKILLSPKLSYLYPLIIPFVYFQLALKKKN
ncbi:nucleotidyltransferase family protein [Lentisphaera marina]|uniref:nucleotidyltransferase domain-containing protein n=1 Tax=Lentisphaera marina TaxID=1111041 RepID=UPI002366238B|nr:nucleotidyltransferase family protein [Lentisphaera marina]MDD7984749.1 nucleotidyltransferase family protein [Lentisphaera marina]